MNNQQKYGKIYYAENKTKSNHYTEILLKRDLIFKRNNRKYLQKC